jgi:hypothetical protein
LRRFSRTGAVRAACLTPRHHSPASPAPFVQQVDHTPGSQPFDQEFRKPLEASLPASTRLERVCDVRQQPEGNGLLDAPRLIHSHYRLVNASWLSRDRRPLPLPPVCPQRSQKRRVGFRCAGSQARVCCRCLSLAPPHILLVHRTGTARSPQSRNCSGSSTVWTSQVDPAPFAPPESAPTSSSRDTTHDTPDWRNPAAPMDQRHGGCQAYV